MKENKEIICIMGATATGKTDLAIQLVQHFPFEIISVDSAMVYKNMDIGSAKPTHEILKIAPHHLIDICDPADSYSAGQFRRDAFRVMEDIFKRGKIPLLVGGTMLYFYVLQNEVALLPKANSSIRDKITDEALEYGWPVLHERLKAIDPCTAAKLHPNESQRIQRALEVYEITGQSMSALQSQQDKKILPYDVINIALEASDRPLLHERIAQRFQKMMQHGFLEEVEQLKKRNDLHADLPSIRKAGYAQAWAYLHGNYDKSTMEERAIISTRQLAKRQLTWLRHWENVNRYEFNDNKLFDKIVKDLPIKYVST